MSNPDMQFTNLSVKDLKHFIYSSQTDQHVNQHCVSVLQNKFFFFFFNFHVLF